MMTALSTAVLEYILAADHHTYVVEASGLVLLSGVLSAVTLPVFLIWSLNIWPIERGALGIRAVALPSHSDE